LDRTGEGAAMLRKIWQAIRGESKSRARITLRVVATTLVVFLVAGVFVVAGAAGLARSNTEPFFI
jgi:hypothetical protein